MTVAMVLRRPRLVITRERATLPSTCRVANMLTTADLRIMKMCFGSENANSLRNEASPGYQKGKKGGNTIAFKTVSDQEEN